MSRKKKVTVLRDFEVYGEYIVLDAEMIRGRGRNPDGTPKFKRATKFKASGPHLTLYKTEKNARRQSTHHYGSLKYARPIHGIVLRFRPQDLEPLDLTPDERVDFYKEQMEKWRLRLLELGLSNAELQVVCEDQMLLWGNEMKKYESEAKQ